MAFGSVTLVPGVNVERTPTALQASIASSQLIRFRDSFVQKYGGWSKFYAFNIAGVCRELHAWQDLNGAQHLLAGTTSSLDMITNMSLLDITPQQFISNPSPNFSTVANSTTVTITDTNVTGVSVLDAVMINTPISVGSTVISGLFKVAAALGGNAYTINIAAAAGTTASTAGTLPLFAVTTTANLVTVTFTSHGLSSTALGQTVAFQTTTSLKGLTVVGVYPITWISTDSFSLNAAQVATGAATTFMNGGNANLQYFISSGPASGGAGYGTGTYGSAGYGTGVAFSNQTGTPITSSDWTSDNWGQIILENSTGGPIYQYDPTGGFNTASIVPTAPPFNNGIFISNSLQILFAYGSTENANIGQSLDPMLIRWSDLSDYTQFQALTTNQAGDFRIPIGSVIRCGMAVANQSLFWTDLDLWVANYAGFPLVFGFNKVGSGAGAISSHAAQQLRGGVYWMGPSNFYAYSGGAVRVLPCPVWDFVFQNLKTGSDANGRPYTANVRAMPNTPFNEAGWLFPSASSSNGECDSYVKMNLSEPNAPWDYGSLPRSAWIDQTVLGNPISATPTGIIYQQETTNDADGQPLTSSFTTGYFYIGEGEEYAFVDQILPDFKFGTFGGSPTAQIQMSFNVVNFLGDTPVTYGPYIVNSSTDLISVRFRGRQMSVTITSSDSGSFWRIGRVRYRWAPSGRQ